MNHLSYLGCSGVCERTFAPAQLNSVCPDCGKPLLARYDLERLAKTWHKEDLTGRAALRWRSQRPSTWSRRPVLCCSTSSARWTTRCFRGPEVSNVQAFERRFPVR